MNELFAIGRTFEIDDGQARGFVLMRAEKSGKAKPWPILITRKANQFFAFENACPHKGSRRIRGRASFLTRKVISSPAAIITPDSIQIPGHCFIGHCQGQRLRPITLVIDDGDVCLTGVQLAEGMGSIFQIRTRCQRS
jgi:nitrite reductase/ring-hydroxylating ferredoxin subunit